VKRLLIFDPMIAWDYVISS